MPLSEETQKQLIERGREAEIPTLVTKLIDFMNYSSFPHFDAEGGLVENVRTVFFLRFRELNYDQRVSALQNMLNRIRSLRSIFSENPIDFNSYRLLISAMETVATEEREDGGRTSPISATRGLSPSGSGGSPSPFPSYVGGGGGGGGGSRSPFSIPGRPPVEGVGGVPIARQRSNSLPSRLRNIDPVRPRSLSERGNVTNDRYSPVGGAGDYRRSPTPALGRYAPGGPYDDTIGGGGAGGGRDYSDRAVSSSDSEGGGGGGAGARRLEIGGIPDEAAGIADLKDLADRLRRVEREAGVTLEDIQKNITQLLATYHNGYGFNHHHRKNAKRLSETIILARNLDMVVRPLQEEFRRISSHLDPDSSYYWTLNRSLDLSDFFVYRQIQRDSVASSDAAPVAVINPGEPGAITTYMVETPVVPRSLQHLQNQIMARYEMVILKDTPICDHSSTRPFLGFKDITFEILNPYAVLVHPEIQILAIITVKGEAPIVFRGEDDPRYGFRELLRRLPRRTVTGQTTYIQELIDHLHDEGNFIPCTWRSIPYPYSLFFRIYLNIVLLRRVPIPQSWSIEQLIRNINPPRT